MIGTSNEIRFISGGTNANINSANNVIVAGQWMHVAFVLNNGTGYLYLNGSQVGTGSLTSVNTPTGNTNVRIGQRVSGGSTPFNGEIDEVRIWNVARTASEISANMNSEFCSVPTGLIAYYKLDEGTAGGTNTGVTSAPDLSGNNYNGTLNGFALTGTSSNWVTGVSLGSSVTTATVSLVGCDSLVSPSGNYTWYTAGTYLDTISTTAGCDSALTVNLSINNSSTNTINVTTCESYTSPSGLHTWTSSGTYTDVLTNAIGCDSILTVNLTINNSYTTVSASACSTYTSPSGNYTWTSSGTYQDTLSNVLGCDSVLTINLNIIGVAGPTNTTVTACNSYTSPSGNYTWTSTGLYRDTIPSAIGCDSALLIELIITGNEILDTLTTSSCSAYTSPSGNKTWTTSGMYFDTIPRAASCDSIIAIDLTIGNVDTTVSSIGDTLMANAAGATYQWINCATNTAIASATNALFIPTQSGSYAVEVTENGCSDTSACRTINVVGIGKIKGKSKALVYPNPTQSEITIDLSQVEFNTLQLTVFDSKGSVVNSIDHFAGNQLNVSLGENVGVYTIQLLIDGSLETHRVVKTK